MSTTATATNGEIEEEPCGTAKGASRGSLRQITRMCAKSAPSLGFKRRRRGWELTAVGAVPGILTPPPPRTTARQKGSENIHIVRCVQQVVVSVSLSGEG